MPRTVAICFALSFLGGLCLLCGWIMAWRLAPQDSKASLPKWMTAWCLKGFLLPLAIWSVMNLELSWTFQPFMPEIQAAKSLGDPWIPEFLRVWGAGVFVIGSYWGALTLGWVFVRTWRGLDGEARKDFKALCCTSALAMAVPGVLLLLFGGVESLGLATMGLLIPAGAYAPNLLRPRPRPPMYARAIARMKFGKYSEAEWEIIRELEKAQDDFEGWMMLAELYAKHFNDLREAEQTILGVTEQPATTPSQLSIALHRLADWQLNLAGDPEAARRSLQVICDRMPGTHLARMAQLRINQIPRSAEELKQEQVAHKIPLPALAESLDEPLPPETDADLAQHRAEANRCVGVLRENPNHHGSRERLARLLAEHLNQAQRGIDQLNLLLNLPDCPEEKRAHWLSLVAAWQLKYLRNQAAGRETLLRLVRTFPSTPEALAARRRLEQMEAELRRRTTPRPPPIPPIRLQP